jgi:hypothetical protein
MHPSFGRYELLKRLAGGGMGEVYLARQRGSAGFQKLLVIKTLLPHLCENEELIVMFKDEARVTAQLIHPNICQIVGFEQVDGIYYMAMEYLRGEDLRRLWKACEQNGTPLPVPLICRVISDAAAGLDFAHSLRDSAGQPYNIVHRDISPQNILVTFEGGVKVIDFGVAKASGRAQHTRTGALKGKYSYMSPEQVAGDAVDNRSDIFALGIVLHELLTGHRLFKADSDVQTLSRVRDCVVRPPSSLNPQLPAGLDAIVLKALAKNPRHRFRTAQELRLALEDWLTQDRMSASSAHLAEFLKVVYAERLSKEARWGPLLGEDGFTGPAPGASITFASSKTHPLGKRQRIWVAVAATAAAAMLAAVVVSKPVPVAAPAIAETRSTLQPASPGESRRTAPAVHLVTLDTVPPGAAVYEGAQLIGKTPKIWSDAGEGAHQLRLAHDGYRDQTTSILVSKDGQEFSFKLHKLEIAKRTAPDLGLKAER